MSHDFWQFSLSVYASQDVAQCAVAVQDEMGLDVNSILYASWLASQDLQMTPSHLTDLEACVAEWRQRVVSPLRALRRQLNGYPDASPIREGIKTLELQSERRQQDMMWEFFLRAPGLPGCQRPLEGNLGLLVKPATANVDLWEPLVDALARAIPR